MKEKHLNLLAAAVAVVTVGALGFHHAKPAPKPAVKVVKVVVTPSPTPSVTPTPVRYEKPAAGQTR